MADKSVLDLEAKAANTARTAFLTPMRAAMDVLNLATKLQRNDQPAGRLSKSEIVRLLLLQRVQNDLRCCFILAERGYPLQAASIAAGIFEAWVTVANIKTEDDAVKWLSHSSETESFGPIRRLTKQAVQNIVSDAQQADRWYSQYQQLCMAKHLNPIVERARGYRLEGKTLTFQPGPDTSAAGTVGLNPGTVRGI